MSDVLQTWLINASDPEKVGLLRSLDQKTPARNVHVFRDQDLEVYIRPLVESGESDAPLFKDLAVAGAQISAAFGPVDQNVTGGTFLIDYEGDTTAALDFDATESEVETALNALASITAAGGVTVSRLNNLYKVTFNSVGARSDLTFDVSDLTPSGLIRQAKRTTGDASTAEVQSFILYRRPYASTPEGGWTLSTSGTMSSTVVSAGTISSPQVVKISADRTPSGGTFRFSYEVAEITKIFFSSGNTGVKHQAVLNFAGTTFSGGEFVDLYDTNGDIIRLWFDQDNASAAPPAPAVGRLLEVDFAAGDTTTQILTAANSALTGDPSFDAGQVNIDQLLVKWTNAGTVAAAVMTGATGSTYAVSVTGSNGDLAGKYVIVHDEIGAVGFYFTAGTTTSIPSALTTGSATYRQVPVPLTLSDANTDAATAFAAAAAANGWTGASALTSTVTMTDPVAGAREAGSTDSSSIAVVAYREGIGISVDVPVEATAADFQDLLDDEFVVSQSKVYTPWTLTRAVNGVMPDPTLDDASVEWPKIFRGVLSFDTLMLEEAFEDTTDDTLDGILEVTITLPGKRPDVILHMPATADRNLIRLAGTTTPILVHPITELNGIEVLWSVDGYIGGTTNLDGISTINKAVPRMFMFIHPTDGGRIYRLVEGFDAESSPDVIRPDDYNALTNAKVWKSVL